LTNAATSDDEKRILNHKKGGTFTLRPQTGHSVPKPSGRTRRRRGGGGGGGGGDRDRGHEKGIVSNQGGEKKNQLRVQFASHRGRDKSPIRRGEKARGKKTPKRIEPRARRVSVGEADVERWTIRTKKPKQPGNNFSKQTGKDGARKRGKI